MNESILMAILGVIAGTIFITLYNFAWKKIKKELGFDLSYVFTMLISAIASVAILPVFFINNALPPNNVVFVFLATASMGAVLNLLVNAPVSYGLGKLNVLKTALWLPQKFLFQHPHLLSVNLRHSSPQSQSLAYVSCF